MNSYFQTDFSSTISMIDRYLVDLTKEYMCVCVCMCVYVCVCICVCVWVCVCLCVILAAICPLKNYSMLKISCRYRILPPNFFFHLQFVLLRELSNAQHQLQLAGIIYSSAQFFSVLSSPISHSWELFNTKHLVGGYCFSSNSDCYYYYYFQTWLFASIPNALVHIWIACLLDLPFVVLLHFCCFAPHLTLAE